MDFRDFFGELGSVDQDQIRSFLSDMSSSGSKSRIDSLEVRFRSIHKEINKINATRESLSSKLQNAESAAQILSQKLSEDKESPIWLQFMSELLNEYVVELKQLIEDSKPNEQLKEKYLIRAKVKSLQARSAIADCLLGEIDGN